MPAHSTAESVFDANHTFISAAGPPVDSVHLLSWLVISIFTFVVFGVVRPAVVGQEGTGFPEPAGDASGDEARKRNDERDHRLWVIRQLFSCAWTWALLDLVQRLMLYVFASPTMLWRRRMLPLPQSSVFGKGDWINQIRLIVLCGPGWHGSGAHTTAQYLLLGGFFRDVYAITGADIEDNAGITEWATSCQRAAHWKLPVSGMLHNVPLSAMREEQQERLRQFASEGQKNHAIFEYHRTVVAAVLICILSAISVYRVVSFFMPRTTHRTPLSAARISQRDAAGADKPIRVPRPSAGGRGEADDSVVNCAESQAEEARLLALEQSEQLNKLAKEGFTDSSMTLTVMECWPTLLSCCYGGMFAYSGGMPIMMQYMFPAVVLLASGVAMVFAA